MARYGEGLYGIGLYGVGAVPVPDPWGTVPDTGIDRWRKAREGGVKPVARLTVTVPGGEPVELALDANAPVLQVDKKLDRGNRYAARAEVIREVGQDTFALVTTPGAIFRITYGWDYGAGLVETRAMGVYELGRKPKGSRYGRISLDLADLWRRLDECRLIEPVIGKVGDTRTGLVRQHVAAAMPGVSFIASANGGKIGTETTWDEARTSLVNDLARDGKFLAYFDAEGTFVIEPDPVLAPKHPVETFVDGPDATILGLEDEVIDKPLYNGVVVRPQDDGDDPEPKKKGKSSQSWAQVEVWITDPTHPRHPDKIGRRPYFYSSPTLANSGAATSAGVSLLQRVASDVTRVDISTWAAGHIDPGDTVATVESATYADAGLARIWLVEDVKYDAITTATTITARSADTIPTED